MAFFYRTLVSTRGFFPSFHKSEAKERTISFSALSNAPPRPLVGVSNLHTICAQHLLVNEFHLSEGFDSLHRSKGKKLHLKFIILYQRVPFGRLESFHYFQNQFYEVKDFVWMICLPPDSWFSHKVLRRSSSKTAD